MQHLQSIKERRNLTASSSQFSYWGTESNINLRQFFVLGSIRKVMLLIRGHCCDSDLIPNKPHDLAWESGFLVSDIWLKQLQKARNNDVSLKTHVPPFTIVEITNVFFVLTATLIGKSVGSNRFTTPARWVSRVPLVRERKKKMAREWVRCNDCPLDIINGPNYARRYLSTG